MLYIRENKIKLLTHPVSPHHEVAEANIVVEADLAGGHSSRRQDLLGQLDVGHRLQRLVVVT